jgi:hypothetical protein
MAQVTIDRISGRIDVESKFGLRGLPLKKRNYNGGGRSDAGDNYPQLRLSKVSRAVCAVRRRVSG